VGVIWIHAELQQSPILNLHLPEDGQLRAEAVCVAVFCVLCTVCCVLFTVCCVLCTVCCVLCTVCCVLRTVYCVLCTVYCVLCTVFCVLCTVYCVLCAVYCVLCAVYCVLRTVCCVLCAVYCVLCTVCCVLCAVYCVLCTVFCVLCAVCCVLCTVYCVLCAVFCVLCAVYCVLCTVCCVLCTVYCVLCTVYCVLCAVYCVLCLLVHCWTVFRGVRWGPAAFSTVQLYWDMTPGLSVNGHRCFGGTLLPPVDRLQLEAAICHHCLSVRWTARLDVCGHCHGELKSRIWTTKTRHWGSGHRHENKSCSRNVLYSNYRPHATQNPGHVWPRVTGTECPCRANSTQHCLFLLFTLWRRNFLLNFSTPCI